MKLIRFAIVPAKVQAGRQYGEPFVRVCGACPCGCSPDPFVSLSDGEVGLTLHFETDLEIRQFKRAVRNLPKTDWLMKVSVPKEGQERG